MRNRLTATMRKGIQRRRRPHFNTRRARLGVCWTRQQSVMRSAMSSHLSRYRWKQRLAQRPDTFQRLHETLDAAIEAVAGVDRCIAANRTWLTLGQARELFPRKD